MSDNKYSPAAHQGESFAPLIPDMKLQLCLQAKPKWMTDFKCFLQWTSTNYHRSHLTDKHLHSISNISTAKHWDSRTEDPFLNTRQSFICHIWDCKADLNVCCIALVENSSVFLFIARVDVLNSLPHLFDCWWPASFTVSPNSNALGWEGETTSMHIGRESEGVQSKSLYYMSA